MNSLKKYLSWAIIFSITTTSYSPPFPGDSLGLKFEFLHKLPGKKDIIGALSKKRVAAFIAPLALLGLAIKYDPYYKAAELFTLFDYIENQMNEEQMKNFLISLNISLDSYWTYFEVEENQYKLNIENKWTQSSLKFFEPQLKVLNQPKLINNEFVDTTHSLHPYAFTQVNGDTISQNGSGFPLHKLSESTHSPVCKHPGCAQGWGFNNPNSFEEFKQVWFTALNQTFGAYYNNGKISISVSLAHNNMKWLNEQRNELIVALFDTILKKSKDDESFELILDTLGLVHNAQNKFTGNNHWGLALMMIRNAIKTAPKNSHLKTMINYLRLRLNPFNFGRIHSDLPEIMKINN